MAISDSVPCPMKSTFARTFRIGKKKLQPPPPSLPSQPLPQLPLPLFPRPHQAPPPHVRIFVQQQRRQDPFEFHERCRVPLPNRVGWAALLDLCRRLLHERVLRLPDLQCWKRMARASAFHHGRAHRSGGGVFESSENQGAVRAPRGEVNGVQSKSDDYIR